MPVTAIIGGQWGDEGKGKIVDLLAENADVVARFSGGTNAGHTVVNSQGEFKLHLIPAGIFHPQIDCIIGNGVVINPKTLLQEIDALRERGIGVQRLFISDRAHLIMPYHILLDELEESARGNGAIGTTKQGIGPAYMDKAARWGIRVGELLEKDLFSKRLKGFLEFKNSIITRVFESQPLAFNEIFAEYCGYADRLRPFVNETSLLLNQAVDKNKNVLLEGAQGTMLDIDFGTYPYVTSSPPTAWGACLGTGLSPKRINNIIGVFKAYTTRVGGGPFPTEVTDVPGEEMRARGKEYGTTTGRPRRCGWFDGVAARYSARLNGFTGLVITKFDILDTFETIKICTGYEFNGAILDNMPVNTDMLEKCTPVYEELPGWQTDTSTIQSFEELPAAARQYIRKIEEIVDCPVDVASIGANRNQSIIINPVM